MHRFSQAPKPLTAQIFGASLSGQSCRATLWRYTRFPEFGGVSQENRTTPPEKGPVAPTFSALKGCVALPKLPLGRYHDTGGCCSYTVAVSPVALQWGFRNLFLQDGYVKRQIQSRVWAWVHADGGMCLCKMSHFWDFSRFVAPFAAFVRAFSHQNGLQKSVNDAQPNRADKALLCNAPFNYTPFPCHRWTDKHPTTVYSLSGSSLNFDILELSRKFWQFLASSSQVIKGLRCFLQV